MFNVDYLVPNTSTLYTLFKSSILIQYLGITIVHKKSKLEQIFLEQNVTIKYMFYYSKNVLRSSVTLIFAELFFFK